MTSKSSNTSNNKAGSPKTTSNTPNAEITDPTLMGIPRECRWRIMDYHLRSVPDLEKQYYPIRSGGKYEPPRFHDRRSHAPLLVNKELHSNYLVEAEKAVVHVLNYDKKTMDKDVHGHWDFQKIFKQHIQREWCWHTIPIYTYPAPTISRMKFRFRLEDYAHFFSNPDRSNLNMSAFTSKIHRPLQALLRHFPNLTEVEIDWISTSLINNPSINLTQALEEVLKSLPGIREIHVHRDREDFEPQERQRVLDREEAIARRFGVKSSIVFNIVMRREGRDVRLFRSRGRWFSVENFYKMRVLKGLMRVRG